MEIRFDPEVVTALQTYIETGETPASGEAAELVRALSSEEVAALKRLLQGFGPRCFCNGSGPGTKPMK